MTGVEIVVTFVDQADQIGFREGLKRYALTAYRSVRIELTPGQAVFFAHRKPTESIERMWIEGLEEVTP